MTQPNHKKVQWNSQTESYEVISNPEWDIETEVEIYSSLVNQGVPDKLAVDIVSVFNTTRPVYACYCHTEHQSVGHWFNPCPCADCEAIARIEGYDITQPVDHIQIGKNAVHVVGSMVAKALPELNKLISKEGYSISSEDFEMFKSLLRTYAQSEDSWSVVVDSYEPKNDDYYAVTSILENFWIAYVLNNPVITGHKLT